MYTSKKCIFTKKNIFELDSKLTHKLTFDSKPYNNEILASVSLMQMSKGISSINLQFSESCRRGGAVFVLFCVSVS